MRDKVKLAALLVYIVISLIPLVIFALREVQCGNWRERCSAIDTYLTSHRLTD